MRLSRFFKLFLRASFEVQLAMTCSALCLISGLVLTYLASVSHFYLQEENQNNLGQALADQLSRQIIEPIETGDLLDLVGSLQSFTTDFPVKVALAYDIEESIIARSGKTTHRFPRYTAPIVIGKDLAGHAVIELDNSRKEFLQFRFIVSLMGLATFFSIVIFFITKKLSGLITQRLRAASEKLAIQETINIEENNILVELERQIENLPLTLLKSPITTNSVDKVSKEFAVVYLKLDSVEKYIRTLDEASLRLYVDRIRLIISSAAEFYRGNTKIVRPFGSAIFFDEQEDHLSAAFRAVSCSQLIRSIQQEIHGKIDLSICIRMAADLCEVEKRGSQDIYAGIYIQTCLNELQEQCESTEDELSLSRKILGASETQQTLEISDESSGHNRFVRAGYFDVPELDLIDRQRWMIMRKIGILD